MIALWENAYAALKVQLNNILEEYERLYGCLDVRDKVVIDIGADYGSTARYFLSKGASKVIAYEANPVLKERFVQELGGNPQIEINGAWDGDMPAGDVLKMDCEMCEYMLKEEQLQQFGQWAIGVHRPRYGMPKVLALQSMLLRNGGMMWSDMGFEALYVKHAWVKP